MPSRILNHYIVGTTEAYDNYAKAAILNEEFYPPTNEYKPQNYSTVVNAWLKPWYRTSLIAAEEYERLHPTGRKYTMHRSNTTGEVLHLDDLKGIISLDTTFKLSSKNQTMMDDGGGQQDIRLSSYYFYE